MADFGVSEWLAVVGAASAATGAGVSAYGAYEQGQAAQSQAQYQAAVAKNNQDIAAQYAQTETQRGQVLEDQKRQETANRIGAIRAAAGASGLDVNTGSPLRLQEDTAKLGEEDALTIRNNAQRAAYGFQVQGMNFAGQASLLDSEASNAARAGSLGAWSSIIGGASSVSQQWLQFRRTGVIKGSPYTGG